MPSGFTVEVAIHSPGDCPVATATNDTGSATDVSRTSTDDSTVTEEFVVPEKTTVRNEQLNEIATSESRSRYRFSRSRGRDCACEVIERTGGPVSRISARDGTLYVSLVVRNREAIRQVVTRLREQYDDVVVHRLVPAGSPSGSDPVVVDRSELTDRQREVLETAYERGFFEYPRAANTSEVADALDISRSTFREHLAAIQRKLFENILDE